MTTKLLVKEDAKAEKIFTRQKKICAEKKSAQIFSEKLFLDAFFAATAILPLKFDYAFEPAGLRF